MRLVFIRLSVGSVSSGVGETLFAVLEGFGAFILHLFSEPGMLEGIECADTLVGVVDEDFLEEVEELFVERAIRGYDVLKNAIRTGHGLRRKEMSYG